MGKIATLTLDPAPESCIDCPLLNVQRISDKAAAWECPATGRKIVVTQVIGGQLKIPNCPLEIAEEIDVCCNGCGKIYKSTHQDCGVCGVGISVFVDEEMAQIIMQLVTSKDEIGLKELQTKFDDL